MIKFILFPFFLLLILLFLMGFSVFRTLKRALFGSGSDNDKKREKYHHRASAGTSGQQRSRQARDNDMHRQQQKKKLFAKDDGEYVDYEEIK